MKLLRSLRVVLCVLCVSAVNHAVFAAADGEHLPTPEQLKADKAKNFRQPATYDPSRSTWKAQVVALTQPPEPVREDYATLRHGRPWDFNDNTVQDLKGQLHLTDLRVEGGILRYTTQENAEIFWGNHYGNQPEYGEGAAFTSSSTWRVFMSLNSLLPVLIFPPMVLNILTLMFEIRVGLNWLVPSWSWILSGIGINLGV